MNGAAGGPGRGLLPAGGREERGADRFLRTFYSNARYYSIVARQNYALRICWFVRQCLEQFSSGAIRSGLDLCCGPALHSIDLAEDGTQMIGVDLSAEMLEIGRENVEERRVPVELVQGDMLSFDLGRVVDFAINIGVNTNHILSHEEMLRHLGSVAAHVRSGGLYVLDFEWVVNRLESRGRRFDPPYIVFRTRPGFVARGYVGPMRVTFQFGDDSIRFDPIRQTYRSKYFILFEEGGETLRVIEEEWTGKVHQPLEFKTLVERSGEWELINWYHEYFLSAELKERPEAPGYVTVLRRR